MDKRFIRCISCKTPLKSGVSCFVGLPYVFRAGKSEHDALDAVWIGLKQKKVDWVLEADIQGFFDTINHEWMLKFVEHRVADPRILRLIRKWLKAGVSDDGQWIHAFRSKCLSGDVVVVRYADDTVLGSSISMRQRNVSRLCVKDWVSLAFYSTRRKPD